MQRKTLDRTQGRVTVRLGRVESVAAPVPDMFLQDGGTLSQMQLPPPNSEQSSGHITTMFYLALMVLTWLGLRTIGNADKVKVKVKGQLGVI